MRRPQFKIDFEVSGRLRLIGVRAKRDGKKRLEIFDRNRLVILDLETFRPTRWNGVMRALNTELRFASSAPRSPICKSPGSMDCCLSWLSIS